MQICPQPDYAFIFFAALGLAGSGHDLAAAITRSSREPAAQTIYQANLKFFALTHLLLTTSN